MLCEIAPKCNKHYRNHRKYVQEGSSISGCNRLHFFKFSPQLHSGYTPSPAYLFPDSGWQSNAILKKGNDNMASFWGGLWKSELIWWLNTCQVTARKCCAFRMTVSNIDILKNNHFVKQLIPSMWQSLC